MGLPPVTTVDRVAKHGLSALALCALVFVVYQNTQINAENQRALTAAVTSMQQAVVTQSDALKTFMERVEKVHTQQIETLNKIQSSLRVKGNTQSNRPQIDNLGGTP